MKNLLENFWFGTIVFASVVFIIMFLFASDIEAEEASKTETTKNNVEKEKKDNSIAGALKSFAAALAISVAAVATSTAQTAIGTAGIAAIAEDKKAFGPALIFLALPETILIFGFTVAAIILFVV